MFPAIVSGRENSNQRSSSKSFKPIHHAFMCSDDHVEIVLGKEAFHAIWAEFYDIACLRRISQVVCIDSKFTVRFSGI